MRPTSSLAVTLSVGSLAALVALCFTAHADTCGPSANDQTSPEIAKLTRLLLEGDGEGAPTFPSDELDSRLQAMERLTEIANPQAVDVLYRLLTRPDVCQGLRIAAILALGRIGTQESIAALARYEDWMEWRRTTPGPFLFGPKHSPIHHFYPIALKPERTARATDGRWWAIFQWDKFGLRNDEGGMLDWWVTSSVDRRNWEQPILVQPPGKPRHLLPEIVQDPSLLDQFTRDTDADGLPDLVEARLGTDPGSADTDQDGVSDGLDGNPLTPAGRASGDEADIRQAVFTILFTTTDSEHPIYLVDTGEFAKQEYRCHQGPVLRSPAIKRGRVNITGFRLKLESPTSAVVTIHDYEDTEARSTHEAALRKVHGRWVVVDFRMVAIS